MNTHIITTTALSMTKGEEFTVHKKSKEKKPGFTMIGNGQATSHQDVSIDLLQEVANMSANERLCFFMIRDAIHYDKWDKRFVYQVPVDLSGLTASQKSKFSNGFTRLKSKDLVRRVRKSTYMVNPRAIIPVDGYDKEMIEWEKLGD